jgi:hypothetical protein
MSRPVRFPAAACADRDLQGGQVGGLEEQQLVEDGAGDTVDDPLPLRLALAHHDLAAAPAVEPYGRVAEAPEDLALPVPESGVRLRSVPQELVGERGVVAPPHRARPHVREVRASA